MDAVTTKILIIAGLLLMTLSAGLLPLFCLKLTTHLKRKSQKKKRNATNSLYHKLRFCTRSDSSAENGDLKPSILEVRRSHFRKKMLLSVLNCFAGGIFLGTSFIGLLPEIRKGFSKADITWPDITNR